MVTEGNYYRAILESVWGYDEELLKTMTDEDCEHEYDVISSTTDVI